MGSWVPMLLTAAAFIVAGWVIRKLWREHKSDKASKRALARSIASRFERKGYIE